MKLTAHKLAKLLNELPDLPVVINGWGSDEGFTYQIEHLTIEDHPDHGRVIFPGYAGCYTNKTTIPTPNE